jgi:DNA-binding transcriptional regulator YiaG
MEAEIERLAAHDLRRIRRRYNLTQVEWARLTGLSLVSINRWEGGKRKQGKATDYYYRLLEHPRVFQILLEIRPSSTDRTKSAGSRGK